MINSEIMKCESTLIIECPECGKSLGMQNHVNKSSYGMNLYSDGNCKGKYFEKEINITSCPNCASYFWLTDAKQIGLKVNDPKTEGNELIVKFPNKKDFEEIIKFKSLKNSTEKEKYIRTQIWQIHNFELYQKKSIDQEYYTENVNQLIELIHPNEELDLLTLAELNRNIGNFEKCLSLLEKCSSEDLRIFVRKIKKKAQIKDTLIFEIYD